jgi:catechol 2,3-dioxygenase-like lactoylglutathione lyase family enzyme
MPGPGRCRQPVIAGKEAPMFQPTNAFSSFAVPDLEAARRFYGDTLGLQVSNEPEMGMLELQVGSGQPVLVYSKPDHRPAVYTVLNFPVSDIDRAVADLNAAGVEMQRYDMGGEMRADEHGIYRGQGPAIAWFTDPAGNILSILEQEASPS